MKGDHQRPAASETDAGPPVISPTHAERCRTLAAQARAGTLCTIARDPDGYPYGSLVTIAFDDQGRPLLLLSDLAEHSGNLARRPEASVLVAEPIEARAEPLAIGRVTLLGPCARVERGDRDVVRARFLETQPNASYYVDFDDFRFYRLETEAIRYVGGFGRMSWVGAAEYREAKPDPLAPAAEGILAHMNDDHADAVLAYARAFGAMPDATSATMTAVDRYGFELAAITPAGKRARRIAFDAPVTTTDEVRKAMVALVKRARSELGGTPAGS